MGTIIEFPAAATRRATAGASNFPTPATIVILPVIRIERHTAEPSDGHGPETADSKGRGRRRRARS